MLYENNTTKARLTIDVEKCLKDGICADECPVHIISLAGPSGVPKIRNGAESACIGCGHCVAVCPYGALDCSAAPLSESTPIQKEWRIGKDQSVQFLRSRRSARKFQTTPVPKGKLQELIDIARYAPTASNSQRVEWIVFSDRNQLDNLIDQTITWMQSLIAEGPHAVYSPYIVPAVEAWHAGQDRILRSAPALVLAMAPFEAVYGMVDLTISLSYLDLVAPSIGLTTCWAGILHRAMEYNPELKSFAGIPETHPHFYPMMVGYPRYSYHRLPSRKQPQITWR